MCLDEWFMFICFWFNIVYYDNVFIYGILFYSLSFIILRFSVSCSDFEDDVVGSFLGFR